VPRIKSAKKALRQSRKRAVFNRKIREETKKIVRKFRRNPNLKAIDKVFSLLDKAAKKNVFTKGKSDRLKSRLSKLLNKKVPAQKPAKKAKTSVKKKK